ncbi:MAG: Jag N-terminal domain-containing protein [Clostridiales bacterium]|nr:Jag N-terminal domain-containing protein [Clostridiales bacterium]
MSTKYIETTGKTEEEAIQKALRQLNLERDEVSVEVLARAKTGFLGIGSSPAKIKVSYEVADEPAPQPEPVAPPAAPAPAPAPVAEEAPKAEEPAPAAKPAAPAPEKAEKPVQKKQRSQRKKAPAREAAPVKAQVEEASAAPAAEPVFSAPAEDDEIAQHITQFLTGLMAQLEVEATPAILVSDTGVYSVELVGENLGALIGRRGETLDAIQQLTNYSINRGRAKRVRIHLDAEGYRAKREESLQRLAQKTANKAIKYRRNMMLEPMNAYERHVIHAALQDYDPCISTYSTGTEPNRRLVVAYNRNGR